MALMTTLPVVMESRELEVCMSALLEQRNLSDLIPLADGTSHVCFGTRSVDKTDSFRERSSNLTPNLRFRVDGKQFGNEGFLKQ